MPVAEIFMNDAEMIRGLLRVTGKHRLEHKENAVSPPSSAFNTLSSSSSQMHRSLSDTAASPTSAPSPSSKVPSAFSSTATHFTPIILSEKDKDKPNEYKEKKVARSLKELKRNLLKNRQNINLVQDIEQDAAQGDRLGSQTPGSKVKSKSTSSQPDLQQTSAISPQILPSGTVLGQGPSPHLMQSIQQQQTLHHGFMSAPQLHQQSHLFQQQQMYQTQAGMMQAPGVIQGGQMMMQPGQYPHSQNPVLSPGVQQYGSIPFTGSSMYPMHYLVFKMYNKESRCSYNRIPEPECLHWYQCRLSKQAMFNCPARLLSTTRLRLYRPGTVARLVNTIISDNRAGIVAEAG